MYRWPELQFGSWNTSGVAHGARETASVVQLVEALHNDATRERALHLLSKSARNASLHLLAPFQLRMPNAYYLVLEANHQKLTLRVWLPAQEAKHSARRPGLGAPLDRAIREELAPVLWHSVGTISILLQEIISVYHSLYSPMLTERESNRVCDALVLFKNIITVLEVIKHKALITLTSPMPLASLHKVILGATRKAKLPIYLYPFLNNTNKDRAHEFLRLTSLGVIGALAKVDDPNVINFLLESEVFPCCLRCMEVGNELSKTVSALTSNIAYFKLVASTVFQHSVAYLRLLGSERFFALVRVLGNMVEKLVEEGKLAEDHSKRLLKHIIWCYHRLSESPRSCDGLRCCLPVILSDAAFIDMFRGDPSAMQHLHQLFHNVSDRTSRAQQIEQLIGSLVRG
ncbi:unnamed protein product [Dovyalis caffra]|uniref:Uncharacterized protein n=1 Tax=Dovyalis caffra TaxID=77055 RepID=A0AAV1SC19_9ROSI|nr:unnamed protein product [Dovyalis caffra]